MLGSQPQVHQRFRRDAALLRNLVDFFCELLFNSKEVLLAFQLAFEMGFLNIIEFQKTMFIPKIRSTSEFIASDSPPKSPTPEE